MGMIWWMLLAVAAAGAGGGVINALLHDKGFRLPRKEQVNGETVLRPGWIVNVVIGAAAAALSWCLYGPVAAVALLSYEEPPPNASAARTVVTQKVELTLASLGGAVIVGIGGARWLSNEVDKKLLHAAVGAAAAKPGNPAAADQIKAATSVKDVVQLVNRM